MFVLLEPLTLPSHPGAVPVPMPNPNPEQSLSGYSCIFCVTCDASGSHALDALGVNAAGLSRKFVLSRAEEIDVGEDCQIFSVDDFKNDCNEDGDERG